MSYPAIAFRIALAVSLTGLPCVAASQEHEPLLRITPFFHYASFGDFYNGRVQVNGQDAGTHRVVLGAAPSVGIGLSLRVPGTRLLLLGDLATQASSNESNYVMSCDETGDCDQWFAELSTRHLFAGAAWQLRRSRGRGPDVFWRLGYSRLHVTDVYLGGTFSSFTENAGYLTGLDLDFPLNRVIALNGRLHFSHLTFDNDEFGRLSTPSPSAKVTYDPYSMNVMSAGGGVTLRF